MITRVQLLEGPPPKFPRAKIRPNFGAIFETFDFDREYLRNGSTYRISEKNVINHNPFHVGRINFGELWSTNKNVLLAHIDQPT